MVHRGRRLGSGRKKPFLPGRPRQPRAGAGRAACPIGPTVQVSGGKQTKVATYQDLLKSPYDEALLNYYAAGQIVEVDVLTGGLKKDRRGGHLRRRPRPRPMAPFCSSITSSGPTPTAFR